MAFRHWCPYSTHTHTTGATRRREWWKFPSFFFSRFSFLLLLVFIYIFLCVFHHVVIDRLQSWGTCDVNRFLLNPCGLSADRRSSATSPQNPARPSFYLNYREMKNVHFVEPTEKKKKTNLKKEGKESEMRFIRRTECNKTTTKAFSNHFGALRLIAWLARPARSLYMCIYRRSRWRCCQAYRNWWKEKKEGKKRKWEKKKKRSGMNHATGTDPFDSCFHSVPRFSFTSFSLPFFFSIYSSFHFHVHN